VRVTVLHHYNGSTKTARLQAPAVSRQMVDGGIHVVLYDEQGGPAIGDAMFTAGGIVVLSGVAIDQYGPLGKPSSTEREEVDG
jgi:hypothetical protein